MKARIRTRITLLSLVGCLLLSACEIVAAGGHNQYVRQSAQQIEFLNRALLRFHNQTGRFPSTAEGLGVLSVTRDGREQARSAWTLLDPWLQAALPRNESSTPIRDPWGHALHYRYPAQHGDLAFDLWSAGRNGIVEAGAGDDLSNWAGYSREHYPDPDSAFRLVLWILLLDLPLLLAFKPTTAMLLAWMSGRPALRA